MNIYAYIQPNYCEEPCSSEQWLGAVKLPAGLLLSPRALPYPTGCSRGGNFCCVCECGWERRGLRLGQVGVSSWRVQLTSPLQKWSHPASSSSSSSSSWAVLAHVAVTMLPKLLSASVELEMFVLVFQKINIFFIDGANKGRKRESVGRFHPSAVALMNLAQDFVNRLFLHSDSIGDFC